MLSNLLTVELLLGWKGVEILTHYCVEFQGLQPLFQHRFQNLAQHGSPRGPPEEKLEIVWLFQKTDVSRREALLLHSRGLEGQYGFWETPGSGF